MKTHFLVLAALLLAFASLAQPQPPPMIAGVGSRSPGSQPVARDARNYLIRIEWQEPKSEAKVLELLTTEGNFQMDGLQKEMVKINSNNVPQTIKVSGDIRILDEEKGRLQLFLGRTVPYVTGFGANGMSSYSQMSVGLSSAYIVTFGKPIVVQSDDNGKILVLVRRMTD